MSKFRVILLIVAILIVAVAIIVKVVIFRKSDTNVSSKKPDIEMESALLVKNFETDENISNSKYLNKVILVTGPVDNISVNKDDITVYLKPKNETAGVMCSFSKGEISDKAVDVGKTVKIKGICNGYLMDVVLNKCSLVK